MTYLQLLEELESLTDEQLDMPAIIYVGDPCEENEYYDLFELDFGITDDEEHPILVI